MLLFVVYGVAMLGICSGASIGVDVGVNPFPPLKEAGGVVMQPPITEPMPFKDPMGEPIKMEDSSMLPMPASPLPPPPPPPPMPPMDDMGAVPTEPDENNDLKAEEYNYGYRPWYNNPYYNNNYYGNYYNRPYYPPYYYRPPNYYRPSYYPGYYNSYYNYRNPQYYYT